MIRSFTRWAALACTAAALALTSAGAFAQATITLTDSNCSDFSLGGSPGARTLTCVVSAPPVCTITGPTAGTINSPITLTANCAPAATSYVWTATPTSGGCASSTIVTCQDTQTATGTITYTVKGTNVIGPGNPSPNYQVVWSNTPPPVPSGCTLTANPTNLAVGGGTVNLTANCTGGGAPTSYAWTGAGLLASTTTVNTNSASITSTTQFGVTPSNAGGNGNTVTATTTVATGGGGGIDCAAQGYPNTKVIDMPWAGNAIANTADYGGFTATDAFVIRFTTGSAQSTGAGTLSMYEFNGPTVPRIGALSPSAIPCDFTVGLPTYQSGGGRSAFLGEMEPTVRFAVNRNIKNAANLLPNTVYYVTIGNMPGVCAGDCAMQFRMSKPSE
jgi:hypothetical protein